ncbi:MAG: Asp-tRNA(Asn)/Glu-tRNA(Gln) amidotransferase GatCAB subunit B, partial [Deferribacterales bacterium]
IVTKEQVEDIRKTMPEMPDKVREKLSNLYGLPEYDVEILSSSKELYDYFIETVQIYYNPKSISNWIQTEILRVMNETGKGIRGINITPTYLAEIIELIDKSVISVKIAKEVIEDVINTGKSPKKIVDEKGLVQIADESELEKIVKKVLENSPKEVERFKSGEKKLTGFFVGQIMKETKGKANPKIVNELLEKLLK